MKVINRNFLKIIAVIAMFLDHLGKIFLPDVLFLQVIGRISFPIFAFFIAEGYFYTKSRKKYFLTMLIFAILSQPVYYFAFSKIGLNILFTFAFSIILIYLLENIKRDKLIFSIYIIIYFIIFLMLDIFNFISYEFVGIVLPLIFYFFRTSNLKYIIATIALAFLSIFSVPYQFACIIAIPLLMLYNNKKGKYNLKYFFYTFYPLHLLVFALIKLFI